MVTTKRFLQVLLVLWLCGVALFAYLAPSAPILMAISCAIYSAVCVFIACGAIMAVGR